MASLRLTHLKLSGFKSFVDPTTLHLQGQRVGIVGPNGCGKSNIFEAVRWVMGESSARELRGDSMQDVIFSGTTLRKPVSRASVELHFDNSLGGAPGQWAEYAEIVVRRVLERDGQSSYLINNTQVRRRDVLDLFLGTGVGSRAYGIIGQNTISRIVEAKPEELRIFLEEAAGVSKYKERRHETELRLRDTRENLTRVEDIRGELAKQIVQLESQAEVAEQYHQLKHRLDTSQRMFWLLKKRQAAINLEKARKRVEMLVNSLEAEMASLRKSESFLENHRVQQSDSAEKLQRAQGAFYEAGSALSGLEQEFKHAQENAVRNETYLRDLAAQSLQLDASIEKEQAALDEQRRLLGEAEQGAMVSRTYLDACQGTIPRLEQICNAVRHDLHVAQEEQAQYERNIQLESANLKHHGREIEQLRARQSRLQEERNGISSPDPTLIEDIEGRLEQVRKQLADCESEIAALQMGEAAGQGDLHSALQNANEIGRKAVQAEAKISTIRKIQQAVGSHAKLGDWLSSHNLQNMPRFWSSVRVHPGWEVAVEHVLGDRLNALVVSTLSVSGASAPPTCVTLCSEGVARRAEAPRSGFQPLAEKVGSFSEAMSAVLEDWLAGVYVAASLSDALSRRSELRPGETLVSPEGHIVSFTSMRLYAPGASMDGVLERQRELLALEDEFPKLKQDQESAQANLQEIQLGLEQTRQHLAGQQQIHKQLNLQLQALLLELQRQQQLRRHIEDRTIQIGHELEEITRKISEGENLSEESVSRLQTSEVKLPQTRARCDALRAAVTDQEKELVEARSKLREADRGAQESEFKIREINNKIKEINNNINVKSENKSGILKQIEAAQAHSFLGQVEVLQSRIKDAVEKRRHCEEAMANARNALSGIEQQLAEEERRRMQTEHNLHPLRDRLEQARLSEQEVRLDFEHWAEELQGVNESELALQLKEDAKPEEMMRQVEDFNQAIEKLGAVNLAAIEQLGIERERIQFLDSQSQDLNAAIVTLEEAIRRIDRETRSRLQNTYDEVNRNFSELFTTLFDGGQARLELLGEEILDSGVQVFAQPPGKKNSTIHLLSGGEKAMTAIALVFAMFRLNPAPFCLMDEVDAPLDDSNTERFCSMVRKMSQRTQFVFISHNKIAMEMAQQLVGVTMQESGVSRVVEVDVEAALRMVEEIA